MLYQSTEDTLFPHLQSQCEPNEAKTSVRANPTIEWYIFYGVKIAVVTQVELISIK